MGWGDWGLGAGGAGAGEAAGEQDLEEQGVLEAGEGGGSCVLNTQTALSGWRQRRVLDLKCSRFFFLIEIFLKTVTLINLKGLQNG